MENTGDLMEATCALVTAGATLASLKVVYDYKKNVKKTNVNHKTVYLHSAWIFRLKFCCVIRVWMCQGQPLCFISSFIWSRS